MALAELTSSEDGPSEGGVTNFVIFQSSLEDSSRILSLIMLILISQGWLFEDMIRAWFASLSACSLPGQDVKESNEYKI